MFEAKYARYFPLIKENIQQVNEKYRNFFGFILQYRYLACGKKENAIDAITVLDFRHLLAPAPMERALQAADALQPGQQVDILTPFLPQPLFALLDMRGLQWQAETLADGSARVRIHYPVSTP